MKQAVVVVFAFLLAATASGVQAQMLDHLKCHKMKDPQRLRATADVDAMQAEFSATGCTLGKPKLYCVPATKRNVQPPEAVVFTVDGQELQNDFICYNLRCPDNAPPDTGVTDQFGSRTQTKYKTSLLCTPAVKGTITTTSTSPGQTTTTVAGGGGSGCGSAAAPECNGSCPTAGNVCANAGGHCGCVGGAPACGTYQGYPSCSGTCPASTPWCKALGTNGCTCSATP